MNSLYFKIVDFVLLAKKLEFLVRKKYDYKGESIFRGLVDKKIPYKGIILYKQEEFTFFFHGTGIEFASKHRMIDYNHYGGKDGLGVYFTLQRIFEDFEYRPSKKIKEELESLIRQGLIKQWRPEIPLSEVFYLV